MMSALNISVKFLIAEDVILSPVWLLISQCFIGRVFLFRVVIHIKFNKIFQSCNRLQKNLT